MQSFAKHPVQFFRRLIERIRAWKTRGQSVATPMPLLFPQFGPQLHQLHRDVTPHGVRFYSLCGDCGARLNASATLCDECAQKRSRPARPY
jgi:hypothetical protein